MIINSYKVHLSVNNDTSDQDQEVLHEAISELYLDDHIQDAIEEVLNDQGLKNIKVRVLELW